jgi:hypothetical protein
VNAQREPRPVAPLLDRFHEAGERRDHRARQDWGFDGARADHGRGEAGE